MKNKQLIAICIALINAVRDIDSKRKVYRAYISINGKRLHYNYPSCDNISLEGIIVTIDYWYDNRWVNIISLNHSKVTRDADLSILTQLLLITVTMSKANAVKLLDLSSH